MPKTKIAGALAVLTLATALALPSDAQARPRWGLVAGIVGTAIVAGAIADAYAEPVYVERRCKWVRQYNDAGFYVGRERVCYVD
jgi:hypothetical protein